MALLGDGFFYASGPEKRRWQDGVGGRVSPARRQLPRPRRGTGSFYLAAEGPGESQPVPALPPPPGLEQVEGSVDENALHRSLDGVDGHPRSRSPSRVGHFASPEYVPPKVP